MTGLPYIKKKSHYRWLLLTYVNEKWAHYPINRREVAIFFSEVKPFLERTQEQSWAISIQTFPDKFML